MLTGVVIYDVTHHIGSGTIGAPLMLSFDRMAPTVLYVRALDLTKPAGSCQIR